MDLVRELRRGAVRLLVLHYAAMMPVTGVWMAEQLERLGYPISPGTLYPLLHRLVADGLLETIDQTAGPRVWRAFAPTRQGRAALADARAALAGLAAEVMEAQRGRSAGSLGGL